MFKYFLFFWIKNILHNWSHITVPYHFSWKICLNFLFRLHLLFIIISNQAYAQPQYFEYYSQNPEALCLLKDQYSTLGSISLVQALPNLTQQNAYTDCSILWKKIHEKTYLLVNINHRKNRIHTKIHFIVL